MVRVHQNNIKMWFRSHSVHNSTSGKKYTNRWHCEQCSIPKKKREREKNAVILNHTISCTGNVCRPWADRHSFICSFIQELSGSQPEIILFSRGICQCLEIFWVIPSGAGGSATGILWIVTRDAAKHPIICKAAHYNKELSRPKCQ